MAITMLAGYLVIINAAALLMMAEDKRRAKRHQWRVPEAALFGAALLGGSAGAWAGMYLFHHKTKHWYFVVGMPLILAAQLAAGVWLAHLLTKEVQKSSMSKQTDNKQFWQRWASCYGPLMQSSEPLYAAIAQQMQPHLTPEMNVLELACGSGQLSFRLSRLVRDWEATDFSPKMIAQAKLKPRGAGLHFSVQDATSLPYADETFDAVLIANALHIMPRPEKALAEIYRVLKPGGQLFAPTFVHGEVPRTRLRMLAMRCAGLQIYNSWMVPQYLAFLQAGGFAVQEHALLGDSLAPLCYARAVPDKTRVTQR